MPNRLDYRAPDYTIDHVDLTFDIREREVHVRARSRLRRLVDQACDLRLDGVELTLDGIALNGIALAPEKFALDPLGLTVRDPGAHFELDIRTTLKPHENFSCEGLYAAGLSLLTQCEAEGFRRITYFLDRPDVLARYTTTIIADRERYPILLSNGNRESSPNKPAQPSLPKESPPTSSADAEPASGSRILGQDDQWMSRQTFTDPHPKPSYLFALVAGDLAALEDSFYTADGREVSLRIYTAPGETGRARHAMSSLKRAMRWDEERFGLSYDLDEFNIVATHDFNMGAMENKGLNIFNASVVLADQDIATDQDLEVIEAVVAHEYFHNWTGNRVTCRDWFQLTLKEGLTVFRDQAFSTDQSQSGVKRIDDVERLRRLQFAEDAGALSHPIRPESYSEINNFYTMTIYEKGAEVVRLYETLLGREGFRRGMDLYFQRHDGQAVTCDDFRAAMADANGRDLSQLERWYSQAGTPTLRVALAQSGSTLTLEFQQSGRTAAQALPIPIRYRVFGLSGAPLGDEALFVLEQAAASVTIEVNEPATVSMLRGLSAPVKLEFERDLIALKVLALNDDDPVARHDAKALLERSALLARIEGNHGLADIRLAALLEVQRVQLETLGDEAYLSRALKSLDESALDDHFAALPLDKIAAAFDWLEQARSSDLRDAALKRLLDLDSRPPALYSLDGAAARALRGVLWILLGATAQSIQSARLSLEHADNLSDRLYALKALARAGVPDIQALLEAFYTRWAHEPLVVNKWFALQGASATLGTPQDIRRLLGHAAFQLNNPNRARSLLISFARDNRRGFHRIDGAGYRLVADSIAQLDAFNPQIAARLCEPFGVCQRLDADRRGILREVLVELRAKCHSLNVLELLDKALA